MILNNSIAFVGDPHIQFSAPTSRIDNYFLAVVNKLSQILQDNNYTICLGDLFSNPVLDIQGTMVMIELLTEYRNKGGIFYSLIGNHDVYNWNTKTLGKTTLGLLAKLGLVQIIDASGEVEESLLPMSKVDIDGFTIKPLILNNPKPVPETTNKNSILIGHTYYAFARDPKHSLEYEDLKDVTYKYIFLGHDHEFYKPKDLEGGVLYRPGSLGREAAHSYNFTRKIVYYQIDLDSEDRVPQAIELDIAPASEVFSVEVLEKHEDSTPAYVYDLEELMKSFRSKKTINISIKKMMEDNPEIPSEVVKFIADCHEACGLSFV